MACTIATGHRKGRMSSHSTPRRIRRRCCSRCWRSSSAASIRSRAGDHSRFVGWAGASQEGGSMSSWLGRAPEERTVVPSVCSTSQSGLGSSGTGTSR
jgi:hypothetical protein